MVNTYYKINSYKYEPTKTIRNYSFMAYQLALTSTVKTSRHCALIIDHKSNILEIFINTPVEKGTTIHAEAGVCAQYLNNRKTYPKNCWLLVIRGNMLGDIKMSRPCLDCLNCIKEHNISKVVWSTGYMKFECADI